MHKEICTKLTNIIPKLNSICQKGKNGRIGVIGGSFEYTGAPFYTAISCLKFGADLAHIFCSKSAAIPIKSYSPELIVHPIFRLSDEFEDPVSPQALQEMQQVWLQNIKKWEKAIDGWVIGPGLGRDKHMDSFFPKLIRNFQKNTLIVFDADGLYYLTKYPDLLEAIKQYKVILTPNFRELSYLKKLLKIEYVSELKQQRQYIQTLKIVDYNYPFSIMIKGEYDQYLTNSQAFRIVINGGYKRCGGIGDILAGSIATAACWNFQYGPILASWVVKKATRKAFEKQGRGMTAPAVVSELGTSFMTVEKELDQIVKQ